MTTFTESIVEDAALAWLETLGYTVLHGPDIAAGEPGAERSDPDFRDGVLEGRAQWDPNAFDFKRVRGGFLVQERTGVGDELASWTVATKRAPTSAEQADLEFAWRAVASVKSNAIVLARGGATIGIGAGQMSRVDASFLAVHKAKAAGHDTRGAVLGSDAYFPFRDGVDQAVEAGITAIVQPGGSVRDDEVIAAADERGIAMVLTGKRLFRH